MLPGDLTNSDQLFSHQSTTTEVTPQFPVSESTRSALSSVTKIIIGSPNLLTCESRGFKPRIFVKCPKWRLVNVEQSLRVTKSLSKITFLVLRRIWCVFVFTFCT